MVRPTHRVAVDGGKPGTCDGFCIGYLKGQSAGRSVDGKTDIEQARKSQGDVLSRPQTTALHAQASAQGRTCATARAHCSAPLPLAGSARTFCTGRHCIQNARASYRGRAPLPTARVKSPLSPAWMLTASRGRRKPSGQAAPSRVPRTGARKAACPSLAACRRRRSPGVRRQRGRCQGGLCVLVSGCATVRTRGGQGRTKRPNKSLCALGDAIARNVCRAAASASAKRKRHAWAASAASMRCSHG